MAVITAAQARTFELGDLAVVGLAAPSRGARETSVWRLTLAPGAQGTPHRLDREEVFVALAGEAELELDGERHALCAGEALVVPADTDFALANPHGVPFVAVAALPVGGRATMPGGEPFTPPWAE